MKAKVVRKKKANLPAIKLDKELLNSIGRAMEGAILENIAMQRQADDAPLRANKQATANRKRAKGWLWKGRAMSLVAEFKRLVRGRQASWRWRLKKNAVIVGPSTDEVRNLSRYVQLKGYTGWLGLNRRSRDAIRSMVRHWIVTKFQRRSGSK